MTTNKGKHVNTGAANPGAKMHPIHVQIIRYLRQSQGMSYDRIAEEMYCFHHVDISPQQIGFICRNERWKLIPQPPNAQVIAQMG